MSNEKSRMFRRRFRKGVRSLSVLVGGLALVMAGVVFAMSFAQEAGSRHGIQQIAKILVILAGGCLVLRVLFFEIPDAIVARRSPSKQRRDAIYNRKLWQPRLGSDGSRPKQGAAAAVVPPRRNGGSVLVVVLAVLAAVSALVLQVQLTSRARQHATDVAMRRAGLVRAATDATCAALHRLADDPELLVDSPGEKWAKREEVRTPLGIDTLVSVIDENRFFNLNNLADRTDLGAKSPDEILMNLMSVCGQFDAGDRTRAMKDWIDEDNDGPFETPVYLERKPPYACPNRPFVSWNELFDVAGWKRDAFERRPLSTLHGVLNGDLVDCVTIIPAKAGRVMPVNVNTAGRDVLMGILGIDQDVIANAILSMRKNQPIESIDVVQQLMEPALFAQISPYLSVRSDYFRIDAQAFAEGHSASVRALAHRDGEGRVEVVQWMF